VLCRPEQEKAWRSKVGHVTHICSRSCCQQLTDSVLVVCAVCNLFPNMRLDRRIHASVLSPHSCALTPHHTQCTAPMHWIPRVLLPQPMTG
jgi:hypothetical protein